MVRREQWLHLFFFIAVACLSGCEKLGVDKLGFVEIQLTGISNVSLVSATFTGLINGTGRITDHGFVWSASDEAPTVLVNDGIKRLGVRGEGDFSTAVSTLRSDTRYVVRAFVELEDVVIYSKSMLEFRTTQLSLSTLPVKYNGGRIAALQGSLTGLDPNNPVIDYGHCWSTTTAVPTLINSIYSRLGRPTSDRQYASTIDSLANHTTYFIRAYMLANLGNDTIYGEVVEFSTDLYDIWERKEDLPKGGVGGATAFTIGDVGYILHEWQLWVYDPQASKPWVQKSGYPGLAGYSLVAFAIGGKAYIGTGSGGVNDFWEYDPDDASQGTDANGNPLGIWIRRADFSGHGRERSVGFAIADKGYIGLGTWFSPQGEVNYNDFFEYDPVTNEWQAIEKYPDLEKRDAMSFVIGSRAYVVGGSVTNVVWVYDQMTGHWTRKNDFPTAAELGVGFAINGKGYVGTGIVYGISVSTHFWEYDPAQDTWSRKAEFPGAPRRFSSGFTLQGKGYLGFGEFGPLADWWEYTPGK
ncbi:MAG: hypothetical protein R2806_04100 [Saprospiraceae bacterium]